MKKLLLFLLITLAASPLFARSRGGSRSGRSSSSKSSKAARPVKVKGYTKKNGTYVAPHVRTSPNKTKMDNYSTKGNVNPVTGKPGTVDPTKP
jgi:hypothetical protein